MSFNDRVESLWENPKKVNLLENFLYFITITDDQNIEYRYVGKARDGSRLKEYQNNMLKIEARKDRGKVQGYRTVHFALYNALKNDWDIKCHPLENCTKEQVDELETRRIKELKCNLNGGKTWRISHMESLVITELMR